MLVSQNEISLENIAVDFANVNMHKTVKESGKESASPLEATTENYGAKTSSKKTKTKSKVLDNELEVLKNGFETVANALMKSTAELVKPARLVIDESKVWILLEEIGLADDAITKAYVYLVDNPEKLKALLASPEARRKDVLKTIMWMSKTTMSSSTYERETQTQEKNWQGLVRAMRQ
ncbi:hypothetical protein Cgig2_006610 [Carnegiea gigantea]|uniref:Uncharacterized protein n=1 Tax=Carnegiea gigantea TaxID=171969 RepID=A0A9Q1QLR4_9CARY|nr:hypothetical protein Cgig2_006610 [Carnegiea gigantea]